MGIHTWDGYAEYESKALKSYLETIERFCSECHTNKDYGSCKKCPTGIFVDNLKRYIIEMPETSILQKNKIILKIKDALKRMPDLSPCYISAFDETNPNSTFNKLKKFSFELELWEQCFERDTQLYFNKMDIRRMAKEMRRKVEEKK